LAVGGDRGEPPRGNLRFARQRLRFRAHLGKTRALAFDLAARAGKLRLLAAATRERIARLPGLPTVSESGVAGYEAGTWFALVGPAGMPREVSHALYADVKKVLNEPAFKERYVDKQWFEIVANTPEEFAAFLGTEYERWEKVVKLSGVKLE